MTVHCGLCGRPEAQAHSSPLAAVGGTFCLRTAFPQSRERADECAQVAAHLRVGLARGDAPAPELVNHPAHYNASPSGVECIDVVEHMTFNVGTAVKHLWRTGLKGDALVDLRKARWYVDREIARLAKEGKK